MKKLSLLVITALFLAVMGCEDPEAMLYSCNPEVNDWASKYKSSFSDITRAQLASLPLPYKRAVYRTLSPEKQSDLWNEKIDLVIAKNPDQTILTEINSLKTHITPELFSEENYAQSIDYLNNWQNNALTNAVFDSLTFFLNFVCLATEEEINFMLENPESIDYSWFEGGDDMILGPGTGGDNGQNYCYCNWNLTCSDSNIGDCEDGYNNCTERPGCGFLWGSICRGQCNELSPTL